MAQAMGIGLVCWGPFAAGTLAGSNETRLPRKGPLPPVFQTAAKAVSEAAARIGVSNVALALRLLRQSGERPVVPIAAARTVEQIKQIIEADQVVIDLVEVAGLDKIAIPELGPPVA